MGGNKTLEIPSDKLLKMLGKDFKKRIEVTPLEKYEEYYRKIKVAEMERILKVFKAVKEE